MKPIQDCLFLEIKEGEPFECQCANGKVGKFRRGVDTFDFTCENCGLNWWIRIIGRAYESSK